MQFFKFAFVGAQSIAPGQIQLKGNHYSGEGKFESREA
jgi:hypothetical protein